MLSKILTGWKSSRILIQYKSCVNEVMIFRIISEPIGKCANKIHHYLRLSLPTSQIKQFQLSAMLHKKWKRIIQRTSFFVFNFTIVNGAIISTRSSHYIYREWTYVNTNKYTCIWWINFYDTNILSVDNAEKINLFFPRAENFPVFPRLRYTIWKI